MLIRMGFLLSAFLPACKPDVKETAGTMKYFDLKGYFKADSARLSLKHPLITKTVTHNGSTQTQRVYIDNWARELEPFIGSDINKPAWRDSYTVQTGKGLIIYNTTTRNLKTQKIIIKQTDGKVKWILIRNHTKNILYENTEELSYFPDSLYQIVKSQHVRLMNKNLYNIKGVF